MEAFSINALDNLQDDFPLALDCSYDDGFSTGPPSTLPGLKTTDIVFIDLNHAIQREGIGADHSLSDAVTEIPSPFLENIKSI